MYDLKNSLAEVYEWFEVVDFVNKYFDGLTADNFLSPILQIAEQHINYELELSEAAERFVKIYGKITSIMDYESVGNYLDLIINNFNERWFQGGKHPQKLKE